MINRIILEGRIHTVDDKEMKNGTPFAEVKIAAMESYKDNSGQWLQRPALFQFVAFGEAAEQISKVGRSTYVVIEGKLRANEYDGKLYLSAQILSFQIIGANKSNTKIEVKKTEEDDIPF